MLKYSIKFCEMLLNLKKFTTIIRIFYITKYFIEFKPQKVENREPLDIKDF